MKKYKQLRFEWAFLLLLGIVMVMIKETIAAVAFIGSGLYWLIIELVRD